MNTAILGLSPMEFAALVAALVPVPARRLPPGARRPVTLAGAAVFALCAIALALSGIRWPVVPVLAGGALALAVTVPPLFGRHAGRAARWRRWTTRLGSAAALLLVVAGAVTAWALPVPVFPEPSGPYAVGTTVVQWTDTARPEPATSRRDDRRVVVVQLWYPATGTTPAARRARYLGRTEREARTVAHGTAAYLGLPGLVLDQATLATTRSVSGAPAADGRFPVVLFSPGLGGVRTQNTAWAEELASRGYVVAALDHPYDSAVVTLADGRVIRTRLAATGDPAEDNRRAAAWAAVRAADLRFVLTQLGRLDHGGSPGTLAGRLDTGRAAVTGHSLGGAAALQAAREDHRFAAVIDIDGYPRDPAPGPFPQPALALVHDIEPGQERDYVDRMTRVLGLSTAAGYRLTVPGTAHLTFTDAPLFLPPLPALVGSPDRDTGPRDTGSRDTGRPDTGRPDTGPRDTGPRVTADVTAAFLDATLRGAPGDLATTLSAYGRLTAL
ncbi:alpha/beta hydrolase family protein [Nonomuraea montanisoli]|uniref:alpha/beta hydrolase family protein n=1 Tax=Nonomuraea montanisoli TaxID=2741721 RepID=UPI001964A322|nr:hypothetical protein [Nonomuraea montanisoli]